MKTTTYTEQEYTQEEILKALEIDTDFVESVRFTNFSNKLIITFKGEL